MAIDITRLGDDGAEFTGGFPTPAAVTRIYDDLDLNRAVQSYRLFFPSVSGMSIFRGNDDVGVHANSVFGTLNTEPKHVGLTLNSDTPYAPILLDLRDGPMVIELPAGPLICVAMDVNQRWIMDMGLPGPDAGQGGTHLIVPPGYSAPLPEGYHVGHSTSFRVIAGIRSLPVGGDVEAALQRLTTVSVHPLNPDASWTPPIWLDLTSSPQDTSPDRWEDNLEFWRVLHDVIDTEPPLDGFGAAYGELAAIGIEKGKPFEPGRRMTHILEQAARLGSAQMRVQSFADRRPDRIVWPDRQWEWAALRFENGDFETPNGVDAAARDKWFYQAIGASPAMFRRDSKAGSLYWLGLRDSEGTYLGGHDYVLRVPLPVPGKLFWSVTVYDARTRSQIQTPQGRAVISSLFDIGDPTGHTSVDLHFGPDAPRDASKLWVQTLPDAGWFVYFRIYSPEEAAFDGTWKPGDFRRVDI